MLLFSHSRIEPFLLVVVLASQIRPCEDLTVVWAGQSKTFHTCCYIHSGNETCKCQSSGDVHALLSVSLSVLPSTSPPRVHDLAPTAVFRSLCMCHFGSTKD